MDIECLRFDEDGSIEIRVAIERYTASADGASPTQTEHLHDRRPPSSGPRPRGSSQHTPVRGTSAHRRLTSSAGSCTELSRSGFGVLRHPRWVDGFADRRVGRYAAVQDHRRASACRSPSAFAACRAFETTLGLPSCQAARQPPCKLRSEHWPSTRAGRSQVLSRKVRDLGTATLKIVGSPHDSLHGLYRALILAHDERVS
jgi:hypothetical protein